MEWHRLFGLMLLDFFADTPFEVELEKDLSLKRQLLDVVILRKRPGEMRWPLPDGLEDLAAHNLITFKSHQEALDDWALKELTGHYVNYRKQVSPSMRDLLPEEDFRLFAVCARFPQSLAAQTALEEIEPGVYDCRRGTDRIRIIVARQTAQTDDNAILHLFSADLEQVRFGIEHYQWRTSDTSGLVNQLFEAYRLEGLQMPYTMQDFRRDYVKEHLTDLTIEERLQGVPPEELLKTLPPEERLKGLPPEERLKGLPPEERLKGLPPEERLKGLSAEDIEWLQTYLKQLKGEGGPRGETP
jgi:hypothetical protein